MSVIDRQDRVFADGVANVGDPVRLAEFDRTYTAVDGKLTLDPTFDLRSNRLDCIAVPVCGVGFFNYGHFLYDGLPMAVLYRQVAPHLRIRLVGQPLRPWQAQVLEALDLLIDYIPVSGPMVFSRLLANTLLSLHVSQPTVFVRPLYDGLRFRLGAAAPDAPRRLFLSRGGTAAGKRYLRNRNAVEARMAGLGYAIVRPETLGFVEQVSLMAAAEFVVGESGAAMANLGFCPSGAHVIEIQADRFVENWTRGMCFVLGHRWHLYVARTDDTPPPFDDADFGYEVDPDDLAAAVAQMENNA